MILSLIIVNNFGKPRLTKFYKQTVRRMQQQQQQQQQHTLTHHAFTIVKTSHNDIPLLSRIWQAEQEQQQIVRELFATPTARSEAASSFIDAAAWFGVPGARIIYRQYATLYFCFAIDGSESELGILDLIQVLVETLDRHFKNVCELDIIFNSERVHFVVDEMIVGVSNPRLASLNPATRRRSPRGVRLHAPRPVSAPVFILTPTFRLAYVTAGTGSGDQSG